MGKWSGLKGNLPDLPPKGNPSFVERMRARVNEIKQVADLNAVTFLLNHARDRSDNLAEELKTADFEVDALTTAITEMIEAAGLDRVTANGYNYTPSPEPYPQVTDKPAFLAWVSENMPENLMLPHATLEALVKKALGPGGDNEIPPGVDLYLKPGLRRTKAGS